MLARTVARLGGGGGPLFPLGKHGRLAPKHVMSRDVPPAPPKGKRYEKHDVPSKLGRYTHHVTAPYSVKKLVDIPNGPKEAASIASVNLQLSHKKKPMNGIAQQNILEKEKSEALMKHRDFLAHKVKAPETIKRTGDVDTCNEFFERWVLDHRCILNDNPLGVKPVKMPWI